MKLPEITKRGWIACAALALAAILATAILCITLAHRRDSSREAARQSARIPRGTMLTLETTYACCGHSKTQREALICPSDDLARTELQALYPGWQLVSFAQDGATLTRALDMPCEKHYLLRLSGSRLTISHLVDGELREVGSAAISRETLDPELIARLEAGQLADTLAQAEGLIEDIES